MSDYERNTHFQGVAKLLYHELDQAYKRLHRAQVDRITYQMETTERHIRLILTQRAYDFASHVLDETTEHELWAFKQGGEELKNIVPDLTEWPKPD